MIKPRIKSRESKRGETDGSVFPFSISNEVVQNKKSFEISILFFNFATQMQQKSLNMNWWWHTNSGCGM
jgi:hypothetical protein